MKLIGTGTAIITPFNEDRSIDYNALEKLINFQIDSNIDYLVVLGTTGESVTLTNEEKKEITKFVVNKVNNRIPIVLGIGGNNTASVVESIKYADLKGIEAILSVAPYYNKPTQEGIYQHYKQIAEASPLPIILYNVPGRTSSNISAETTLRLARDFKNIAAIKDASGNLTQMMKIIKYKPSEFKLISGDDALLFPMMSIGAEGVISVISNAYPAEFSIMIKAALKKDFDTACKYQLKFLEIIEAIFEEGSPAGIKVILEILGYSKNYVRLPLVEVSENLYKKLNTLVNQL